MLGEQVAWVARHFDAYDLSPATLDAALGALAEAARNQGHGVAATLLDSAR